MNTSGQTLCLSMIVKNETPVIRRCLASVRPLIDSWVIVDTGSDDGTQTMIREFLADLPGELHERPWVDFAHNRSEALTLARGRADYVLVIDADEILEIDEGFTMPPLTADAYNLQVRYGSMCYLRRQLVNNSLPWRYEGVLHEYITCNQAQTEELLPGLCTVPHHDGARARDPLTYKNDAAILERELERDPTNTRYTFYLAQSYRDAGENEAAVRVYRRRVELGGWHEEVWFSMYQIAQLRLRLQHPWPEVMESFLAAWQFDPRRAGPLYRIAMHYQAKEEYRVSHLFLSRAMELSPPGPDALFVEHALYSYQIALDYAVAAYYVGDHDAAIAANNRILASGHLPAFAVDQVIRNRRFSLDLLYRANAEPRSNSPALRVLIPMQAQADDLCPEFDDCIDSIAQQQDSPCTVTVLVSSGAESLRRRIPAHAPATEIVETASPDRSAEPPSLSAESSGLWDTVDSYLRSRPQYDEEIIALLPPSWALASPQSLQTLASLFQDARCLLAYGQQRTAKGTLGLAYPPASKAALAGLDNDPSAGGLLLFSSTLWRSLSDNAPLDALALLRGAGFDGIRFSDDVTCTAKSPPAPRPSPAKPSAAPLPLISCLMITYDRLALAKNSILQFARQSYPERELVIVTDGEPVFRAALERHAAALGLARVRFLYPEGPRQTLGQLRNLAMDAAAGEILCQWDDDDSNHPDRLMVQAGHMLRSGAAASFLTDHLQLIEEKRALCWIDWSRGASTIGPNQVAPGTLMMHRDPRIRYPEEGPHARRGEDSVVLHTLFRHVRVAPLKGEGHLYLYRFHGRNTFSRKHHYNLANFRLPTETMRDRADKLREAARYYDLPEPCCVLGREGPLFVLER